MERDRMNYLDMLLSATIAETCEYMECTGRTESLARFPYLAYLAGRGEKEPPAELCRSVQAVRFQLLVKRLSGEKEEPVIQAGLSLALTASLVPEFLAYLNYFTGSGATLALACGLAGEPDTEHGRLLQCWERLRLVLPAEARVPFTFANMEAGDALLFYLAGEDGGDPALRKWAEFSLCSEALPPMYVHAALAGQGEELLRSGAVLQIAGQGGRRFLAKHIAGRMDRDLLLVHKMRLFADGEPDWERLEMVVRDAFLYGSAVCIYGIGEADYRLWDVAEVFLRAGIPLMLGTDSGVHIFPRTGRLARIELPELTRAERELVWAGFGKKQALPDTPGLCALRYRLNASEISRVLTEGDPSGFCVEKLMDSESRRLGQIVRPQTRLPELMLLPQMKRTLCEIIRGGLEGCRIYEEWGLKDKYAYGRALTVLLAGAPGTGKTMTAHVIAAELGMPLYQVELSRVLDKYIGETEKHLERVFDFAEKAGMVLFFDEADALFGKRSEVSEGKDRYANMEVSYILQRIEQFSGVVVLASNFYHNIDKAFLRRMKYVLRYREPGEEQRRAIWESCLVPELPREELDLDYLAGQFALTGGMIKNIVQVACISALHEDCPLNMRHVLRALRMEYEKLERSVSGDFWGKYKELMKEE
ncbi:MAG: ATP-binding protein [Roseburia sp.]|nr:ATP-binding protein [Roseburia sp.]